MTLNKLIPLAFSLLFINHLFASSPVIVSQFVHNKDWNFVENKGQLATDITDGKAIKFYGGQGGVSLYCKPGSISFVFSRLENGQDAVSEATGTPVETGHALSLSARQQLKPSKIITYRADLVLMNANPDAHIIANEQQEYYENFYLPDGPQQGITNAHTYKKITYQSIYPHIDMVLHARENGMKYEFVVYPGGRPSDIRIQWQGMDKMEMAENGGISYAMGSENPFQPAVFTMKESRPVSFQGSQGIESSFKRDGHSLGFKIGGYDKSQILVIDPELEWCTYFGTVSGTNNIAVDVYGNIFLAGSTTATSGIATTGAYQTAINAAIENAFIVKFTSSGKREWGTYFGYKTTAGDGIVADPSGNVYLYGTPGATSGIATSGAYQTSCNGGNDVFLAKFSGKGARIWCTYYGGPGNESAGGICLDKYANIYIGGFTASSSGIATSGAYLTSYSNPKLPGLDQYDAFLAKFDSSGPFKWGTYYGGPKQDNGGDVAVDSSGNPYIVGRTFSSTGIATSGAYQTSLKGQYDGFIAKFNTDGTKLLWGSYYGGGGENTNSVLVDGANNVYLTGYTGSTSGIATSGGYNTSYSGGQDAFLAKFNGSSGKLTWATYYGGSGNDAGVCLATDKSNNVYLGGYTMSKSGIATSNGYQTSYGGVPANYHYYGDCFFAKFNAGGSLLMGSYFGGSGDDGTIGMVVDRLENLYISGFTTSDTGIATKGAFQTVRDYAGGFLAKFSFVYNDAGIDSVQGPLGNFCTGTETVTAVLKNYGSAILTKATIGWSVNNVAQTSYPWSGSLKSDSTVTIKLGPYHFTTGAAVIKVWTSQPNGSVDSVSDNDTAIVTDTVNALPAANIGLAKAVCSGSSTTIGAGSVPGNTYSWTSNPVGFTSTSSHPTVSPASNTVFYLTETVKSTGCSKLDSVKVTINPLPAAKVVSDTSVCSGASVAIGAPAIKGNSYSWVSNPVGFTSSSSNPLVYPILKTVYTLTETNTNGCVKSNSISISINPAAVAHIGAASSICIGETASIGTTAASGDIYNWTSRPAGYKSTKPNNKVAPTITTKYYLTETNASQCKAVDSVVVTVKPLPNSHFTMNYAGNQAYFHSVDSSLKDSSYHWVFGDGITGTGHSIRHLYTKNKNYNISLTVNNANGCTNTFDTMYSITRSDIENEAAGHFNFSLYPNPFNNVITLQYSLDKLSKITIALFDITGREIGTIAENTQPAGQYSLDIDAERFHLHTGVYLLKFINGDGYTSKRILKL